MRITLCALATLLVLIPSAYAANADDIFILRTSARAPEDIVSAMKAYAAEKKWQFLGASKVKKGQVTLVKICIPEIGRIIWPAGLQLSALLPCGNVGIYRKGAATEISVLHPRYMHILYPGPATEKASAAAQPLLTDMLDAVIK
jgi:hypothetical protein